MSASTWAPQQCAILWDVDGTLVESTKLGYDATNEVLIGQGLEAISVEQYKEGCRYATPARFNFHLGLDHSDKHGDELGQIFDDTYVARVSKETAGLFPGLDRLLRSLAMAGHPQGALSNACGAYVRAVMDANELSELPGERVALFRVALGADEVAAPKPAADGLLRCVSDLSVEAAASVYVGDSPSDGKAAKNAGMRSIGVTWGANSAAALEPNFDVLVDDVDGLTKALRAMLLPEQS